MNHEWDCIGVIIPACAVVIRVIILVIVLFVLASVSRYSSQSITRMIVIARFEMA